MFFFLFFLFLTNLYFIMSYIWTIDLRGRFHFVIYIVQYQANRPQEIVLQASHTIISIYLPHYLNQKI